MAAHIGTAAVTGTITANGHEIGTYSVDVPVTTSVDCDGHAGVVIGPVGPALAQALRSAADALESQE
jgi:hypothetical protein